MNSKAIGFTGTKRGMSQAQIVEVYSILKNLHRLEDNEFHHGDCVGADATAADIAWGLGYKIICHPPINPRHRAWTTHNDRINPEYDYIIRDRHIVDDSNILIAAPHTSYEITRSGTWTTVRYARKIKRSIYIVLPNGTVIRENNLLSYPS